MIATIVNCVAVLAGSLIGVLFHSKVTERFIGIVYIGIGMISLIIGIRMSLESTRILFVALAIVIGGILGNWWNVEGGVYRIGEFFERLLDRVLRPGKYRRRGVEEEKVSNPSDPGHHVKSQGHSLFAHGFLNASILFCVGAMTIVGSFRAGTEGDYDLILTKSVMDGSVAILLASASGIGVAFSAVTILIYQGGLTLLAGVIKPYVSDLVLSELSGTGGVLIVMIGLNLLELRKIKTGNFLPSLVIVLLFTLLEPVLLNIF